MKIIIALAIIAISAVSAEAQDPYYSATPESRYWAYQAAGQYGRAAVNVRSGRFIRAGRNYYYGARNQGRALYFGSRDYRRDRDLIRRSPDWDARQRYFRSR